MKRKLKSIAMQLSESDIQELIRLKKMGDKKVVALRKKRDKLAADLAKLDKQLEALVGEPAPAAPRRARAAKTAGDEPKKRGRKKAAEAAAGKKPRGRKPGRKTRVNLSAAVREVFARAGAPLKASQVVDALPEVGIKVADVSAMRKRISVVLASQKSHFEQVERGVYQLKG